MISTVHSTLWFWILICAQSGETACPPAEEDATATIYCDTPSNNSSSLTIWQATNAGSGYALTLSRCSTTTCIDLNPSMFSASEKSGVNHFRSSMVIKKASRVSPFNLETKWTCNIDGSSVTVCDDLQIFAKPAIPSCDTLTIMNSTDMTLTCRTSKVYPRSNCTFEIKQDSGKSIPLNGTVIYTHSSLSGSPTYYKSECQVIFTKSSMPLKPLAFVVRMYPDVTNGINYRVEKEIPVALPTVSLGPDCPTGNVDPGTTVNCTCTVSSAGYPAGHAQWYTSNDQMAGIANPDNSSFLQFVYHRSDPAEFYVCRGVSFIGHGSDVTFSPMLATGSEKEDSSSDLQIGIGVGCAAAAVLILAVIVGVLVQRRRKTKTMTESQQTTEGLNYDQISPGNRSSGQSVDENYTYELPTLQTTAASASLYDIPRSTSARTVGPVPAVLKPSTFQVASAYVNCLELHSSSVYANEGYHNDEGDTRENEDYHNTRRGLDGAVGYKHEAHEYANNVHKNGDGNDTDIYDNVKRVHEAASDQSDPHPCVDRDEHENAYANVSGRAESVGKDAEIYENVS